MTASSAALRPFVISRTFDAPRDVVWKAHSEQDRLTKWFSPKGFTIVSGTLDFRPGGTYHYCFGMPGGGEMWGKWSYRDIKAPERITAVVQFSDKDGGLTRHPMAPDWPRQTLGTSTFTEQGGKTTITVEWEPLDASDAERTLFDNSHASMTQGWGGTFDLLAEYLATPESRRP